MTRRAFVLGFAGDNLWFVPAPVPQRFISAPAPKGSRARGFVTKAEHWAGHWIRRRVTLGIDA